MEQSGDFAQLRDHLSKDPSRRAWQKVIELLKNWKDEDLQLAVHYAQEHLASWPIWEVESCDLSELLQSPLASLVRAVRVSYAAIPPLEQFQAQLSSENFAGIERFDWNHEDLPLEHWNALLKALPKTLKGLHIEAKAFTQAHFRLWEQATHIPTLESLSLRRMELEGHHLAHILGLPSHTHLKRLQLNQMTLEDPSHLTKAHFWPSLQVLGCIRLKIEEELLGQLFEGPHNWEQMYELHWERSPLTEEHIAELFRKGRLPALKKLNLSYCQIDAKGFQALVKADCFSLLESLSLYDNKIDFVGLQGLEGHSAEQLRELRLNSNQLHNRGVKILMASQAFPNLRTLDLSSNGITLPGARAIAASRSYPHLRSLKLYSNNIKSQGMRFFADIKHFPALRELNLSRNSITWTGIEPLIKKETLPKLESLDLSNNIFYDKAIELLASASHWETLHTLDFEDYDTNLGEHAALSLAKGSLSSFSKLKFGGELSLKGLRALMGSYNAQNLKTLEINSEQTGDKGLAVIAKSKHMHALEELKYNRCQVGEEGLSALLRSPLMQKLTTLELSNNDFSGDTMKLFQKLKKPSSLQTLHISECQIDYQGIRAFIDCKALPKLNTLYLTGNDITRKGFDELLESKHFPNLQYISLWSWNTPFVKGNEDELKALAATKGIHLFT